MTHASSASRQILFESKQEESNEKQDQVWRRWLSFCTLSGVADDPFLLTVPELGWELLLRAFLALYRNAEWSPAGTFAGKR